MKEDDIKIKKMKFIIKMIVSTAELAAWVVIMTTALWARDWPLVVLCFIWIEVGQLRDKT